MPRPSSSSAAWSRTSATRPGSSPPRAAAYHALLDEALADEVITRAEEEHLAGVVDVLFDDPADRLPPPAPYRGQLFVAMVNDGRLPEMADAPIMLKRGEVLHLAETAALLKEAIEREFRSGSRGVSFRVMKGVSYRVGASRGRMVEVGRAIVSADEGDLCVTSHRVVFTGLRKTMEMPYTKLVDLNVFSDGIQIHLSNRQNPPMFRVADGPMVAAAINAAVQRQLG